MAKIEAKKPSVAEWLDGEAQTEALPEPRIEDIWREFPPRFPHGVLPMPPYDGLPVFVTSDRRRADAAVWAITRAFRPGIDGRGGRFEPVGFWAVLNAGHTRIPYEPIAWRPYDWSKL